MDIEYPNFVTPVRISKRAHNILIYIYKLIFLIGRENPSVQTLKSYSNIVFFFLSKTLPIKIYVSW